MNISSITIVTLFSISQDKSLSTYSISLSSGCRASHISSRGRQHCLSFTVQQTSNLAKLYSKHLLTMMTMTQPQNFPAPMVNQQVYLRHGQFTEKSCQQGTMTWPSHQQVKLVTSLFQPYPGYRNNHTDLYAQ